MFILSLILRFAKHILIITTTLFFLSAIYYSLFGILEVYKTDFPEKVKVLSGFSMLLYFLHLCCLFLLFKFIFKFSFLKSLIYSGFIHFGEVMIFGQVIEYISSLENVPVQIPLNEILSHFHEYFNTEELRLKMIDKTNSETIKAEKMIFLTITILSYLMLFITTTIGFFVRKYIKNRYY